MLIGSLLYLAGMVIVLIITIRYGFIFQLVANGRGKVGPRQALRYSCAITKGHLKELIVLELSWIPWYLAVAFSFASQRFISSRTPTLRRPSLIAGCAIRRSRMDGSIRQLSAIKKQARRQKRLFLPTVPSSTCEVQP